MQRRPFGRRQLIAAPARELVLSYARKASNIPARKTTIRRNRHVGTIRSPLKTETAFIREHRELEVIQARLEGLIVDSRGILEIQENWDEEGSVGYSEFTWERAIHFLRESVRSFGLVSRANLMLPKITPGPAGSIDIRWKAESRSLLVNFPADKSRPADFFGSDQGLDTIRGTLDLSFPNVWILMWLTR